MEKQTHGAGRYKLHIFHACTVKNKD